MESQDPKETPEEDLKESEVGQEDRLQDGAVDETESETLNG